MAAAATLDEAQTTSSCKKTRYLRGRFGSPAMYDIDRNVKPRAAVRHIAFQGTKRSIVSDEGHVNCERQCMIIARSHFHDLLCNDAHCFECHAP
jgi:hypothetical protein